MIHGHMRLVAAIGLCLAVPLCAHAQETSDPQATPDPSAQVAPEQLEVPTPEETAQQQTPLPDPAEEQRLADQQRLGDQLRARNEIANIHRAFGIATWAAMAVTAVLGFIAFADEYGFHGREADTACANRTAVFNDFCGPGVFPLPHAIAGITTTALHATTATLSFFMPAPVEASNDVEIHKVLRWFHLGSLVSTLLFGFITANIQADFGTRQALAAVHEGLAITTFGLLTTAAAIVVF
jgi:hypothetical protein